MNYDLLGGDPKKYLLNPHGSDETLLPDYTIEAVYHLLNPHGSDETHNHITFSSGNQNSS